MIAKGRFFLLVIPFVLGISATVFCSDQLRSTAADKQRTSDSNVERTGVLTPVKKSRDDRALRMKSGPVSRQAQIERDVASGDPELLQATVRLRIRHGNTFGYGSGTIVATQGRRALVVTCAHVFEATGLAVEPSVTVFGRDGARPYTGKVLALNQEADVGLVEVNGVNDVRPIPLEEVGFKTQAGQRVHVAGCDRGRNPTSLPTDVIGINRLVGDSNVQVSAMPDDGRSGGGLFTERRTLIGVCQGRNMTYNEGVYAGLSCVHDLLADVPEWQSMVASRSGASLAKLASRPRREHRSKPRHVGNDRNLATKSKASRRPSANRESGFEITCIIRGSDQTNQVIDISNPSPALLTALANESRKRTVSPANSPGDSNISD